MGRISATEASRNFARLLDEVEHSGASYLVERHGRAVAEIRPPRSGGTVGDLRALLREIPPDAAWTRDVETEIAARKALPARDRWPSD
jgi:antitoxin (DNA-binding transcriptional repressor) of toxin-antitoxin stability system